MTTLLWGLVLLLLLLFGRQFAPRHTPEDWHVLSTRTCVAHEEGCHRVGFEMFEMTISIYSAKLVSQRAKEMCEGGVPGVESRSWFGASSVGDRPCGGEDVAVW